MLVMFHVAFTVKALFSSLKASLIKPLKYKNLVFQGLFSKFDLIREVAEQVKVPATLHWMAFFAKYFLE